MDSWGKAGVIAEWLTIFVLGLMLLQIRDGRHALDLQKEAIKQQTKEIEQQTSQIRQEHDWNRRKSAQDLILYVNEQINGLRPDLIASFPDLFAEGKSRSIAADDAKKLFVACKSGNPNQAGKNSCTARKTAAKLLNLLEIIAIAYANQSVDNSMIQDMYDHEMDRFYKYFEELVKVTRQERENPKAWSPLENYITSYTQRVKKTESLRQQTGN
ncbi:MAG: hypothetical protein ABTQ25_13790 [Nitrosomonas ureae]